MQIELELDGLATGVRILDVTNESSGGGSSPTNGGSFMEPIVRALVKLFLNGFYDYAKNDNSQSGIWPKVNDFLAEMLLKQEDAIVAFLVGRFQSGQISLDQIKQLLQSA